MYSSSALQRDFRVVVLMTSSGRNAKPGKKKKLNLVKCMMHHLSSISGSSESNKRAFLSCQPSVLLLAFPIQHLQPVPALARLWLLLQSTCQHQSLCRSIQDPLWHEAAWTVNLRHLEIFSFCHPKQSAGKGCKFCASKG